MQDAEVAPGRYVLWVPDQASGAHRVTARRWNHNLSAFVYDIERVSDGATVSDVRAHRLMPVEWPAIVPVGAIYRYGGGNGTPGYVWVRTHVGWRCINLHDGRVSSDDIVDDDRWLNPSPFYEAL